jgi:Aspartyl protease
MSSFSQWYRCPAVLLGFVYTMGMNSTMATPGMIPPSNKDSLHHNGISINIFTQALTADSSSFVVPFNRAGNLILVQATADTTEGSFILDTGCPHLVLNLTYFRHYPTNYAQDEEKKGMTGTVSSVTQTMIKNFSFGSMKYYRLEADLVNLGHIENNKGVKILGLLGMQLLQQFEMIIDYEKNLIYLHRVGRKEASTYRHAMLDDTAAYHTVPIELTDDRIIVKTEMAGKKLKLIIDSGAESNILDSRLPDKVFEHVAITGRVMVSGAGSTKVEALTGDLQHMKIGMQDIPILRVLITNLEKTCFSYGGCVDGVLGFDFLSLQKIGFNFVTRKMYIWK